ncbi:MAG: hypothetical protein HXY19_02925 [Thermoanaerobaculaceae bacterium]|jgi:hypothetical protein|nr:hypothetical protein [Thermoanaerobaculaceae bacterium]
MKLLMLIIDEGKKEELEVLLNRAGVVGYTEIPRAVGVGATGPRLGSRAFPKTSAIIFTVLTAEALDRLVEEIRSFCSDCGERLKMIVWGVEEVM